MKKIIAIGLLAMSMLMTGCMGFIEDGQVAVRTQFGKTDLAEVNPGFQTWFMSDLTPYTIKETTIALDNMTPKAGDNLSLKEMDVVVYYRANPAMIADLQLKYAGQSAQAKNGVWLPAYNLVKTQAQTVIQDEVSKHQSLTIHTKRNLIEENVKAALQETLDETDNGAFTITRVAVRQVLTDGSIEDAIRKVVQAQKEDEAMNYKLDVAKKQAQLNESLNRTYTPAYLQHEYNMALQTCAENAGCTMVVGLESAQPLLNMR